MPRRKRGRAAPLPPPPEERELVEVVDARDRPFMVTSRAEAHRQILFHRSVLVLVHDASGKVYLQKRSRGKKLFPGRWDLSATGHVLAGESREDAARRELAEELSITRCRLSRLADVAAGPETDYEYVTLFLASGVVEPILPNAEEIEDGYFFDPGELDCLAERFRELMTPALVHCWEKKLVFPGRSGRTPW